MFENLWRAIKAVNKKVWVTAAFAAVIFAVGTTWIVVANASAAFRPVDWTDLETAEQRDTVSGNGGPAVAVGNWLYFVGNYVDTSTIKYRQNEHNNVTYGAIYRVYIDTANNGATGGLLYQDYTETGDPDNAHLLDTSKYQLVVPKVAGFDQAALWIFDRYLIYTSPNNMKDKYGQLQLGKIDFFRVDLDGRNHRKVYTTENEMVTTDNFTVASIGGEVFLLVKDGESLNRVNVTGKQPGKVSTISEKVQKVAFPIVTSYDKVRTLAKSYGGVMSHIYYTEEYDEDEQRNFTGNKIFQYNISRDEKVEARIDGHNFDVLALANGRLFYKVSELKEVGKKGIYSIDAPVFAADMAPFSTASLDNYELLPSTAGFFPEIFDANGSVHMPTVAYEESVPFWFVTVAANNMYIYQQDKSVSAFKIKEELPVIEKGVSKIIRISASTIYYLNDKGAFCAMSWGASGFEIREDLGTLTPETLPWVVTLRGAGDRYFYIKTLEDKEHDHDHDDDDDHEHESFTTAVLADISGGDVKNYLLGRIDEKYI